MVCPYLEISVAFLLEAGDPPQGSGSANFGVSGKLAPGPSKTGAEERQTPGGNGGLSRIFVRFFYLTIISGYNGDYLDIFFF